MSDRSGRNNAWACRLSSLWARRGDGARGSPRGAPPGFRAFQTSLPDRSPFMPSLPRPSQRAVRALVVLLLLLAGGIVVGIRRFSANRASRVAGADGAAAAPGSAASAGARGNGIAQTLDLVAAGADAAPRYRRGPAYVAGLNGRSP